MLIADSKRFIGYVAGSDQIKSASTEAIAAIKKLGIETYLITGDNERAARTVANQV